jgi:hypothetical protein
VKTGWSVENVGERCSSKHEHLCTQEPRTFSLPISPTPLLKQQLKTLIVRKVIDVTMSTLTVCSIPGHFRHLGSRFSEFGPEDDGAFCGRNWHFYDLRAVESASPG